MLSPRRSAQLGLSAACLTLVTCITVLVAGSNEPNHNTNSQIASTSSRVAPLASSQLGALQANLAQQIAIDKR